MRTYVTLAALAVTAAAFGGADGATLPSVTPVQPAAAVDTHVEVAAASFSGFAGHDGADVDAKARHLAPPRPLDADADTDVDAAHLTTQVVAPKPATRTPRATATGRYRTPEAAMRALARAYSRGDDTGLRSLTTPDARRDLTQMRTFAPRMRLVECHDSGYGSYHCTFTHTMKGSGERGTATVQVSPATKPGWYASMLVDCG